MSSRNIYLDIIKGIAIFLVVFGHCLQYGSFLHDGQYWTNNIFKIIYSFHLPLFMLVSGYLFYNSVTCHPFIYNLKTRFTRLIIPIIGWNSLWILFALLPKIINGSNISLYEIIHTYISTLAFLWAVFFASMIVLLVNKLLKDKIYVYLIIWIISFFIPETGNSAICFFLYPFFIIGYFWNKWHIPDILTKSRWIIPSSITILIVIFIIMIPHFSYDHYIYTSGISIVDRFNQGPFLNATIDLKQVSIDLFRFFIGLIGAGLTMALILAIYIITNNKHLNTASTILSSLGKRSLGIYASNIYIIDFLIKILGTNNLPIFSTFIESLFVLALSWLLTIALERIPFCRVFLLGAR